MRARQKYLLPALVALVMSYISSRYLFVGSALNLIPWGILALCFGLIARNTREARGYGAVYGFCQSFMFLWIDKSGKLSLPQFCMLFVIISALSALAAGCAMAGAWLAFSLKDGGKSG